MPSLTTTAKQAIFAMLFLFVFQNAFGVVPVADFSATNFYPCTNQNISFTNTSTGTITSYDWSFGANAIPATSNSSTTVNVQFNVPGTYTVTLLVSGPDGSNSISKSIVVSSTTPSLAGGISGSTSVCLNATSLAYSISPTSNAATYNWTVPSGASITSGQGTSSIITSFGSTAGNICVNSSNGCGVGNQICQAIDLAKEQIVFMNYNLLNYPAQSTIGADTSLRHPLYRTILGYANPDILVAQEVTGQNGVDFFLNNVLNVNSTTYTAGTFINGFDTDNAIFFKTSKFTFVSNTPITTDLRDITEFKLVHILSGDTIRIYSVHLKASNTSPDEAQRSLEADSLRKWTNALPIGSNFIVCGDFNFYKSSEAGYQKLLAVTPGTDGHFIDPISMTGTWNNSIYAANHTQSTRIRAFGGGSTGGLNDRFDLALFSNAMMQSGGISYVSGSTHPLGNDGNHYNDSINKQPNTSVPIDVADALHAAADHLPLICQLEFQNSTCPIADLGVSALVTPSNNICSSTTQQVQVSVKNYGSSTINFAFNNLQISAQVIDPLSNVQNLSGIVNSGSVGPGATITATLSGNANMSLAGMYTINAGTIFSGDPNTANDAMPPASVTVYQNTLASISANSSTTFCPGGAVLLSAAQSMGVTFQWKKNGVNITNANSQNYSATQSGSYQVQLQSSNNISTTYPVSSFSNTNSYTIPNNSCTGASSLISVGGFSGNISSSGISVKININHTAVGDLAIFLQSPSGEILGLSNRTGNNSNTGDNFTNTIFSDNGVGQLPTSGAPYSSTYKPWLTAFTSCTSSTKTTFASLSSGSMNPNGSWKLLVYDRASGNSGGTIVNWSISFPSYTVNSVLVCDPVLSNPINVTVYPNPAITYTPSVPVICSNSGITIVASGANLYSWSPATGLNTTTGSTVFANPVTATTYTVTGTSTDGCISSTTISIALFTQPTVTFSPLSSVCITTTPFTLTGGSPAGGVYSGAGVSGGQFNPASAGVGTHSITYTYTDNHGCSAFAIQPISVTGFPQAVVTPGGPITLCQSSSIDLNTLSGYNYLWSNGATTQSINISNAGSYSVVVSDNNGCSATSSAVIVSTSSLQFMNTVFAETMGTVSGTTSIAAQESSNGFDNDALTMSGTGDLRTTSASSGYSGASGGANVFLTSALGTNFVIAGINTIGLTNIQMSFGVLKTTTASNGSELLVQYSTDGTNFNSLPFTPLPTGSGTAIWALRSVSGIPSSSTLSIRFIQNGITPQFRIDDVIMTSQNSVPSITISGNANLCQGSSVTLISDPGTTYSWDNGETTQSIVVSNSSTHTVVVTGANGCSAVSSPVMITSNPELYTITGGGNYCSGSTPPSVSLSGSQLNVVYQLKNNAANVGSPISGNGSPINFGPQSLSGTYTVSATYTPTSCQAVMNGSVVINVNPLPTAFTLTGNASFCSSSNGSLLGLAGSQLNVLYQLKLNGNNVASSVLGTGSAISFGNQNQVGLYSVVATNVTTNCSNTMSNTINLVQNSSPSMFALSGSGGFCIGSSGASIGLSNSQNGVGYELFNLSGTTGAILSGTGSSLSYGLFTTPSDYYIIATDQTSLCQSNMLDTVTVSYLPQPIVYNVTGGGSFCSVPDNGVPVGLNNSESDVSYQLFLNGSPVGSAAIGSGSSFNFSNQLAPGNYTVIGTKISSACSLTMNLSATVIRNIASLWYADADDDGYGNPAIFVYDCDQPSGYISDNTDCNDANQNINPGALEICGNGIDDNCNGQIDEDCNVTLNLKIFIQGFYLGASTLNSPLNLSPICDTMIVKLASAVSPFNVLYSDTSLLNVNGDLSIAFPTTVLNEQLYIVVIHRNSIETWSALPVLFDQSSINYDFTDANSKAYGNNLYANGDGTFSIYNGDVDRNGLIDFNDYLMLENDIVNFTNYYNVLDLTGDNIVESADYSLLENNINENIIIQKP